MKPANFPSGISKSHFCVVRSGSKISCLAFLCPSTVLFRLYLFDTLWIILFYAGSKQSFSLTYDFAMLRIVRICRCAPSRASSEVSPRHLPALRAAKSVSWIFRVALLFICQGTVCVVVISWTRNSDILSQVFITVKSFFVFFSFFFSSNIFLFPERK